MNVNCVAVSIGNTRTRAAAFVAGKIAQTHALDNNRLEGLSAVLGELVDVVRLLHGPQVLLSSVNPKLDDAVNDAIGSTWDQPVLRIETDLPVPIGRQLDHDTLVGEDRLLNAAAAYGVLKQACVVVDAGTAVTIDFVDGAGTFHGGAIGPGAQMMLDALRAQTAQLPKVTFAAPTEAIGRNTSDAMRSAVFHGLRGMVRELVEQFAEMAGAYPMVIATGGDAETLFAEYDLVDRIVPELTLQGMAMALDVMVQTELES